MLVVNRTGTCKSLPYACRSQREVGIGDPPQYPRDRLRLRRAVLRPRRSPLDAGCWSVHGQCMPVKTITIDLEAYEILSRHKRRAVVLRGHQGTSRVPHDGARSPRCRRAAAAGRRDAEGDRYPGALSAQISGASRDAVTMERAGQRIGAMDPLIATAALVDVAPIVTRNVQYFSRVPGLEVVTY